MTDVLLRGVPEAPDEPTPIDVWLRRQQDLSAVERFAVRHDEADAAGVPLGRWRDRLPATPPGPGQQYAFEVDLDACTGCKACVAACHSLNGLDEGEAWRRVGALHDPGPPAAAAPPGDGGCGTGGGCSTGGGSFGTSATVTSACHHCVDPACLKGCPAQAYEKDPVTGIVRHLDDACIGCSYCTLTCPYEVPVYNASLGIVRKCDLCADRLAEGEAPACVQGCPQGAITIALADVSGLVAAARPADTTRASTAPALVPSAPRSDLTVPATRYVSAAPLADDLVAADRSSVHPSHGHTPLAVMLVLTQAAAGMTVAAAALEASGTVGPDAAGALGVVGIVTGLVALAASVLHLGRPLLAWRAILGLRRSWLSREIAAFGVFATAGVAGPVLDLLDVPAPVPGLAGATAVVGGIAGVACSAQLYAVTGRTWWRLRTTGPRFAATAVAGGAIGTAAVLALAAAPDPADLRRTIAVAAVALAASVAVPLLPLWRSARSPGASPDLDGTRRLLRHQLADRLGLRLWLAALAGLLLAAAAASAGAAARGGTAAGVLLVLAGLVAGAGEYHERRLFFLASVAPRMPGSPR